MSKIMEMKSALKTKKEWYEYIDMLEKGGIFNLDQSSKMYHAIRESKLPEG